MTDTERAEIVRRFEAGQAMFRISIEMNISQKDIKPTVIAELARRAAALQKAQDLVTKVFSEWGYMFDENPAPTYKEAQAYLIDIGRIKPEECVKP